MRSPAGGKLAAAENLLDHCDTLSGFSSLGLPEGSCPAAVGNVETELVGGSYSVREEG